MSLNYVTLTGDLGTTAASAQATFTASNWLTDATDELLIPPEPVTLTLPAAGTFATMLLATDNPAPLPSGWSWSASFQLPGINANTFSFFLPAGPNGFTATHGTPAVFTATAATFISGTGLQLTGTLPGGFGSATTYYVTGASGHTFGLAAANGGSALASTSTGTGSALTVSTDISSVAQYSAAPSVLTYLPLPSGTPTAGYVPVATGTGEASVWTAGGGGGGAVNSVTAGDTSIVVGGTSVNPTIETATLDVIAADHPPAANWSNNSHKITSLANGSSAQDAAAFGQIPSLPLSIANGGTGVTARDWAGLLTPTAVQTSAYNANPGDFVPCDTTSGGFTVTLPTAPADLTVIGIKMVTQGGSNAVTFAAGGSDVFNKTGGSTTGTLSLASQGVIVQYKASGAIWYVYSDDLPLSQLKNLFGFSVITLTDAATIAVNAALGSTFRVTLGGNRTLGTPSNPTDGQRITFEFIQGSGGNFTLAYSGAYTFPASIPSPTLSSTAGQRDFLSFIYDAGVSQWCAVGWVPDQNAGIVPVAQGGTGQSTAAAGYNALSPMTTTGDIEYESATATAARLAGNTTTQKQWLSSTGTGSAAQAPAWSYVPGQYLATPTVYAPASQSNLIAASTTLTQLGLSTTVAAGSNGGEISTIASWSSPSAGVLDVASTAGLPTSGTVWVAASGTSIAVVTYTGVSGGNSLTGCAYVSGSASGTVATGNIVAIDSTTSQVSTGSFTAVSTAVLVTVTFIAAFSAASAGAAFGLLGHGGSTVYGDLFTWRDTAATTARPVSLAFYVTGLTPGSNYNFDLAAAMTATDYVQVQAIGQSTVSPTLSSGSYGGPVTMTVQAV